MDLLPNPALETLTISDNPSHLRKRICVVGAGPTGLAALKIIADAPQYKEGLWEAIAFEERAKVGGIWFPAPPVDDPPVTPLYDSLTTNLPHPIMCFPSLPFPPSTPLFTPASTIQAYLETYTSHFNLTPNIRLNTRVVSVVWLPELSQWSVKTQSTHPSNLPNTQKFAEVYTETHLFDALVIANGHYRTPRYPATPGLDAWRTAGRATHSAWYRRPHDLGATVLVVGAGPSGNDISAEMRTAAKVVIRSVTTPPATAASSVGLAELKYHPHVAEFLDVESGSVRFVDGTVEAGIDHCILATGYQYTFPFLPDDLLTPAVPPPVPPLPRGLYNSTFHVFPLARHLFPITERIPPGSLVTPGLMMKIAPFPLVEAQMRAIVRVWADPGHLDITQEAVGIIERYEKLRAQQEKLRESVGIEVEADAAQGSTDTVQEKIDEELKKTGEEVNLELAIANAWHKFEPLEQFRYRDELHKFAGGEYAGDEWKVPRWAWELYDKALLMRDQWQELERLGEADDWIKGVGEGGEQEWVDLMRKLVKRAEEGSKNAKL